MIYKEVFFVFINKSVLTWQNVGLGGLIFYLTPSPSLVALLRASQLLAMTEGCRDVKVVNFSISSLSFFMLGHDSERQREF